MEIIATHSVNKFFGTTPAADNISLTVKQGEIYGFLGLNGAGKTTLIRMLLGMIKPDSGNFSLFGKNLKRNFSQWNDVGYLVETPHAYPNLTVAENLKVYYRLRDLHNPNLIGNIIDQLKLNAYRDKKAKVLSLGNQQRLGLAKALMHFPKLLVLDEPTNGLDPEGIVEVRELLKSLSLQGSTIFISSHILGEISRIATRIGIIHKGKLIRELNTSDLEGQLLKKIIVDTTNNARAKEILQTQNVDTRVAKDGLIEIYDANAIGQPETISKILVENHILPRQIYLYKEGLEEYFLRAIHNN